MEEKYFIGDMVITQRSNKTRSTHYIIKDHQGSTLMVTNESGSEVNRFYYKPFGEQVDVSLSPLGLHMLRPTQYGYTGHEQIKDLDIINMGGRIYASGLKRFLQADPLVGHPMYSQSYNPYQYVYNNPLVNVDPSGYIVITSATAGYVALTGFTALAIAANDPATRKRMAKALDSAINTIDSLSRELNSGPYISAYKATMAIADAIGVTTETPSKAGEIDGGTPPSEQQDSVFATGGSEIQDSSGTTHTGNDRSASISLTGYPNYGGSTDGVETGLNYVISKSADGKVTESVHPNRLNHIFGKNEHALDGLVKVHGSQEKAYQAMQDAANKALNDGKIMTNSQGVIPSGDDGPVINVAGTEVRLIGGRVVDGAVQISSASRKGM